MQQSNSTSSHKESGTWQIIAAWFQRITYYGLAVIGTLICLGLVYYNFFYTQFMKVQWVDVAEDRKDKPLWNVVALLVFTAVFLGALAAEKHLGDGKKKIVERALVLISSGWILIWGLVWITSLDRIPEGDQAFIYGGASYFLEGGYYFLQPGGYCQIYPQQLGQIAVVELFFLVVGTYNYFAIECVCVLFATGIHLLGYGILREFKAGFAVKGVYCLLMMGCIPLICYTSWVYGDLPSTFFLFLFTVLALRLQKNAKWYYVAGMVFAFMMAALVRKNSMIFLVAFGILAGMDLVIRRRWRMVIAAVLALVISILSYRIVFAVYEYQSGIQIGKGLPVNSWIAMGMEENWNGNGWYSNSPKEAGMVFQWDYDAMERYFASFIRGRLEEFKEDPKYAIAFYKKKILSQWNGPLYQCIFSSKNFPEDRGPEPWSFLDKLYHNWDSYETVLFWADRWQFIIYLGTLLYFLTNVRRKREPVDFLFAVTFVGGFFFSILWEAKSRYCLPYYLMMYSMAVMGYGTLCKGVKHEFEIRRKAKTDSGKDG